MNRFGPGFFLLFSHPLTGWIIMLVAMASRAIQVIFFFNLRVDRSYQAVASKSLLNGEWVSLPQALPADLSSVVFTPLTSWPPAYSFLLGGMQLILTDLNVAALVLDILISFVFVWVFRRLLQRLDLSLLLVNWGTLLSGVFIYDFYFISSTDAIAICFFLLALNLLMKQNVRPSWWNTMWISVFLLLAAWMKYLFIPVALATLLIWAWLVFRSKRKILFHQAGACLFAFMAGTALLLFLQYNQSGNPVYIPKSETGFYPTNLAQAWPFIPCSFIRPDLAYFMSKSFLSPQFLLRLFQFLHLAAFSWLLIYTTRLILKKKVYEPVQVILILSCGLFLTLTCMLVFLSLRYESWMENGALWTYVQEGRYYGLAVVLVQLLVLGFYRRPGKKYRTLSVILLLLLIPEFFHGLWFTGKRVAYTRREEYSWQFDLRFQNAADSLISGLRDHHPEKTVVVCSSIPFISNRVHIGSGVPILYNSRELNHTQNLRTRKPVVILVILFKKDLSEYKNFISYPDKKYLGDFEQYEFYALSVEPGKVAAVSE